MNFTSLEKEIALGRQLAAEIERQVKLFDDPVVNEYVNRVGQNLVRNSDAQVPFTIKVVESEEINAFALPGGFFYVNTGLILAADDESELAGVMAHEIAHVTARHGTEQAAKGQLFNIASIPLIFLGGPIGFGLRQAAGILIPLQFLEFSRDHEAEADYLGLQYLYKTGYDPGAAVSFFEKLQARETAKPGTISKMFRTHPPTEDRITKTKSNIELILPEKEQYVVTTSEFDTIKMRLAEYENRKPQVEEDRGPSLRRPTRRTDTSTDDSDNAPAEAEEEETAPEDRAPEDDDRPVLRRRN
jgi:predicted Zn-dependent protease